MYYSGFADEASKDIDTQIKATKELGWSNIEARSLNGKNLSTLADNEVAALKEKLEEANISINCYGSAIANWGKDARKNEDWEQSLRELNDSIPRLKLLGTKMLRGMSFALPRDTKPDGPEYESILFPKLRELVKICQDNGILYLHENCMNYGGQSYEHTLKLIDAVDSDNFKLVFDTGNPNMTYRRIGRPPYPKQSSWEFYHKVKEHIHYVHIKDNIYEHETDGIFPAARHVWPGEGHGDVRNIVFDLLSSGYDGGFSIEPHIGVVYHDASVQSEKEALYRTYVEYGQRFMKLVDTVKKDIASQQG